MSFRRINPPAAAAATPIVNPPARRRSQTPADATTSPAAPPTPPKPSANVPEQKKARRSRAKVAKKDRPKRQPTGDYEVGNCRPPVSGQIRPGEVRNPRGRPKEALGQDTIRRNLLSEKRTVRLGAKEQKMTVRELLDRTSLREAVEGGKFPHAAHWFAEARRLFPERDNGNAQGSQEIAFSAADDLIIQMLLDGLSPAAAAAITSAVTPPDAEDPDDGD